MNIHPTAVVDPEAEIGPDVVIGPYCVIGREVTIGAGCWLQNQVTVCGPVKIRSRKPVSFVLFYRATDAGSEIRRRADLSRDRRR